MMFSSFIYVPIGLYGHCVDMTQVLLSTIPDAVEYVEAGIVVWLLQIVW